MRPAHKCWCLFGGIPPDAPFIGIGPISGVQGVTDELMRHFGVDPAEHPQAARELEHAAGDVLLDLGREFLAQHGLLPDPTTTPKPGDPITSPPPSRPEQQEKPP